MLAILNSRQIEVEIWREDDLARHRGLVAFGACYAANSRLPCR